MRGWRTVGKRCRHRKTDDEKVLERGVGNLEPVLQINERREELDAFMNVQREEPAEELHHRDVRDIEGLAVIPVNAQEENAIAVVQAPPYEHQEELNQTRIEARLSAAETELGIQDHIEEEMRIRRARIRRVGAQDHVHPGTEIRASGEDVRGKMGSWYVKMRFFWIYQRMKEEILQNRAQDNAGDANAFLNLERYIDAYVSVNRQTYENRREAEEKEKKAFAALKKALSRVHRNERGINAEILLGLLEEGSGGYLEIPQGEEIIYIKDAKIGLGRKQAPECAKMRTFRNRTDMPLFTHRPNIKDIEQGELGDCYLLAGLISIVNQDAEAIMNSMRDNYDGTVTVRFWGWNDDSKVFEPKYVRVKKSIPVYRRKGYDAFSGGALWVKMMEKAYAASGLHLHTNKGMEQRDYDDISGGNVGQFVSTLLGKKSVAFNLKANRTDHELDRIGKLLGRGHEPPWGANSAFGNDGVDSIVYEVLRRENEERAHDFLTMEKSEGSGRVTRGYKDFLADKERISMYIDLVNRIANGLQVDLLSLNSRDAVNQWYGRLTVILHKCAVTISKDKYGRRLTDEETSLYNPEEEDTKIGMSFIKSVKFTHEIEDYSPFLWEKLAPVLDILKEWHLGMFSEDQADAQREENANAGQVPDRYYTTEDMKLYEHIKALLASKSPVTFGTKKFEGKRIGTNGEAESGGVLGGHAYAIIDTREVQDGPRTYRFLVVMNPWAEQGAVYDSEGNNIRRRSIHGKEQGEREEGIFLLELKEFVEAVDTWYAVSI